MPIQQNHFNAREKTTTQHLFLKPIFSNTDPGKKMMSEWTTYFSVVWFYTRAALHFSILKSEENERLEENKSLSSKEPWQKT